VAQGPVSDAAPVAIQDLASWDAAVEKLRLSGAVRQLANHCQFRSVRGGVVYLLLDDAASHLQTAVLQEKFRQALSDRLGTEVRLRIELGRPDVETPAQRINREDLERQQAAEQSIESDPNVLAVQKAFDATIDPASIKPVSH
jgi:DNA polymerase-3 subunit gamma/tau